MFAIIEKCSISQLNQTHVKMLELIQMSEVECTVYYVLCTLYTLTVPNLL